MEGTVGAGMVRAPGNLFLLWNVRYAVAASHPHQRRVALYEAIAMQTVGLVGESLLLGVQFVQGLPLAPSLRAQR